MTNVFLVGVFVGMLLMFLIDHYVYAEAARVWARHVRRHFRDR